MTSFRVVRGLLLAVLVPLCASGLAQQIGTLNAPTKPKSYVTFVSEPQTLIAGKRSVVDLRFRINESFHVNSHTPKSELLIPTQLNLQLPEGVVASPLGYPAGTPYSFSFEPNEKLEVYSGAFTVKLPVTTTAGDHTVTGFLKYQACDQAACYPPKSLPVQLVITGR